MLEYKGNELDQVLQELVKRSVLILNKESNSYELNYDNTSPYYFETRQKASAKRETVTSQERDHVIIVESYISRILKRKKSVQKTDLAKLMSAEMRVDTRLPSMEEINTALEKLDTKGIISIETTRGIVKYID